MSELETCIVCGKLVASKELERHINRCLDSAQPVTSAQPALSSANPITHQALESQLDNLGHMMFTSIQTAENQSVAFHRSAGDLYGPFIALLGHIAGRFQTLKNLSEDSIDLSKNEDALDLMPGLIPVNGDDGKDALELMQGMETNPGMEKVPRMDKPNGPPMGFGKQNSYESKTSMSMSMGFSKPVESVEEREFRLLCEKEGTCDLCKKNVGAENIIVINCDHQFCSPCLKAELLQRIEKIKQPSTKCPYSGCELTLPPSIIKKVLTNEEYDLLEKLSFESYLSNNENYTNCPKCQTGFECVASKNQARDVNETGLDGKPLSKEALQHRNSHRFRCPTCSVNFCKSCKEEPYHLGYTCDSFSMYKNANHCRFCETALNSSNTSKGGGPGLSGQVCTDAACQEKKKFACGKILPCDHLCYGVKDDVECLPCLELENECKSAQKVDKSEFCSICYCEGLSAAPCIKLTCGHIIHFECAKNKISGGRPGSRLTFAFMNCPLCATVMDHPLLQKEMVPLVKLLEDVKAKSIKRLKVEGMENDPRLTDPASSYYQKPLEYAMKSFAYYPCFKCKQPYFGGKRACEEAKDEKKDNNNNQAEDFDASHLVCSGCADVTQTCKNHGTEFIEWKCKFCCNISSWYCWGTTHFCDDCHKKQVSGDYVTKKTKDQLPKCPGAKLCIVKGNHGPPLTEQCLGCAVCRSNSLGF